LANEDLVLCVKVAQEETPIADSRKVFERIDPKIKEQFIQKKIMSETMGKDWIFSGKCLSDK